MLFVLSKIFYFFAAPANFSIVLLMVGTALLLWSQRIVFAKWFVGIGLSGLLIFGFSPLSSLMLAALEDRFPQPASVQTGEYAGIILLGGFENARVSSYRETLTLRESAERLTETVRLAHRLPDAKVIFTGGAATIFRDIDSVGNAVGQYLRDVGIAPARSVLETRSRNTRENAVFTRDMLEPRHGDRYLLVTSAFHMPRAIGVFRKAGFDVTAWPVDYRTAGGSELVLPYRKPTEGLNNANLAVKEYIGLLAYWLAGWTPAVFPEP
jgi:uncharacterized SAM-binding protein YcdF (DUF218 family)